MTNKLSIGNTFMAGIIPAFTTGMGNGSVFGAAVMCAVGRGPFESWGGWGAEAYNPVTFAGFIDVMMLVFGVAFTIICWLAWSRHGALEARGESKAF